MWDKKRGLWQSAHSPQNVPAAQPFEMLEPEVQRYPILHAGHASKDGNQAKP